MKSCRYCFWSYHQIYPKEGDKVHTNSRLTMAILENKVDPNICTYFDDIVIADKNMEDHLTDLIETFASMEKETLHLNLDNCIFGVCQGKILVLPHTT